MQRLQDPADPANRPAFLLPGRTELIIDTKPLSVDVPSEQLSLTGPADRSDKPHLPVRGDLAHIGLAGRYFVPHYAVPMPHRVTAATSLRVAGSDGSDVLRALAAGDTFDVLDMAGGWAWGQVADDGLVGYLPLGVLEALA